MHPGHGALRMAGAMRGHTHVGRRSDGDDYPCQCHVVHMPHGPMGESKTLLRDMLASPPVFVLPLSTLNVPISTVFSIVPGVVWGGGGSTTIAK